MIFFVGILYFFFFKQNTAYEMRIIDWSSDVCSSDLAHDAVVARPAGRPQLAHRAIEVGAFGHNYTNLMTRIPQPFRHARKYRPRPSPQGRVPRASAGNRNRPAPDGCVPRARGGRRAPPSSRSDAARPSRHRPPAPRPAPAAPPPP